VIVDCDTCAVRGPDCADCVVTFLLGPPDWLATEGLPGAEMAALAVLAGSGLVPPLRLIPIAGTATGPDDPADGHRLATG
jgi:hypothetical protein